MKTNTKNTIGLNEISALALSNAIYAAEHNKLTAIKVAGEVLGGKYAAFVSTLFHGYPKTDEGAIAPVKDDALKAQYDADVQIVLNNISNLNAEAVRKNCNAVVIKTDSARRGIEKAVAALLGASVQGTPKAKEALAKTEKESAAKFAKRQREALLENPTPAMQEAETPKAMIAQLEVEIQDRLAKRKIENAARQEGAGAVVKAAKLNLDKTKETEKIIKSMDNTLACYMSGLCGDGDPREIVAKIKAISNDLLSLVADQRDFS